MPVVLRIDGFRFLFYANEGDPREPPHIHVRLGRDEAKFWISPEVILAYKSRAERSCASSRQGDRGSTSRRIGKGVA